MNEEKERDSRKKRNPLFYVFAAIFAAAVIFGIVYYVAVKRPQNKRGEIYDELADAVEKDTPTPSPEPTGTPTTAPTNTPGNTATESPTATETPVPVDIPVSFEEAWKTNKDGTKAYKAFYESLAGKLKVNFHKVKGHSGDRYNDEADKLAKDQLGIS